MEYKYAIYTHRPRKLRLFKAVNTYYWLLCLVFFSIACYEKPKEMFDGI